MALGARQGDKHLLALPHSVFTHPSEAGFYAPHGVKNETDINTMTRPAPSCPEVVAEPGPEPGLLTSRPGGHLSVHNCNSWKATEVPSCGTFCHLPWEKAEAQSLQTQRKARIRIPGAS